MSTQYEPDTPTELLTKLRATASVLNTMDEDFMRSLSQRKESSALNSPLLNTKNLLFFKDWADFTDFENSKRLISVNESGEPYINSRNEDPSRLRYLQEHLNTQALDIFQLKRHLFEDTILQPEALTEQEPMARMIPIQIKTSETIAMINYSRAMQLFNYHVLNPNDNQPIYFGQAHNPSSSPENSKKLLDNIDNLIILGHIILYMIQTTDLNTLNFNSNRTDVYDWAIPNDIWHGLSYVPQQIGIRFHKKDILNLYRALLILIETPQRIKRAYAKLSTNFDKPLTEDSLKYLNVLPVDLISTTKRYFMYHTIPFATLPHAVSKKWLYDLTVLDPRTNAALMKSATNSQLYINTPLDRAIVSLVNGWTSEPILYATTPNLELIKLTKLEDAIYCSIESDIESDIDSINQNETIKFAITDLINQESFVRSIIDDFLVEPASDIQSKIDNYQSIQ